MRQRGDLPKDEIFWDFANMYDKILTNILLDKTSLELTIICENF